MSEIVIICGPTASGKTNLAINLSKKINGAIICADSMQIYDSLRTLTASPTKDELQEAPHYFYNFLHPTERYSVAKFITDIEKVIIEVLNKGYIPILVGGTGFYIDGLINGINQIPDTPSDVKNHVEFLFKNYSLSYIYDELEKIDPAYHKILKPNDKQRILRAYEVSLHTKKSLLDFHKDNKKMPLEKFKKKIFYISPSRDFLYQNCNERFLKIISSGAIDEIIELKDRYPFLNYGVANSLGYKEFCEYIDGKIGKESAIELSQIKTRQYAKRQVTWFNNKLNFDHEKINFSSLDEFKSIDLFTQEPRGNPNHR